MVVVVAEEKKRGGGREVSLSEGKEGAKKEEGERTLLAILAQRRGVGGERKKEGEGRLSLRLVKFRV